MKLLLFVASSFLALWSSLLAAPLASIADDARWQVIPQHPLDADHPPAADDKRWMPLSTYRSREYQLAHPREPGLGLWLQTKVDVAQPPAGGSVILSMANGLIADSAFLNGRAMANEVFAATRPFPHDQQALPAGERPADAPFFARWDDPGNSDYSKLALTRPDFDSIRPAMPPLFSVPSSAVKTGSNLLQLAVYEHEVNTMFPGPVELRAATLADRVQLNSFTRHAGEGTTETFLLVQQSHAGPEPITLTIEMLDDLGAVLWTETPKIDFSADRLQQAIPIRPRSPRDHKAVIRVTTPGQEPLIHWVYLDPQRVRSATRDEYKLDTALWEYRVITQNEEGVVPPPTDNWKPGRTHVWGKRRYYFRTTFTPPADFVAGRHLLKVGFLQHKGDFYLNGQPLGTLRFYDAPGEIDVTSKLRPGQKNELLVVVHDGSAPEFLTDGTPPLKDGDKIPALATRVHFSMTFRASVDQLALVSVPSTRVRQTRIVTSVQNKTLVVTSTLENTGRSPLIVQPRYRVVDRDGEALAFAGQPVTVPAGKSVDAVTRVPWANPKLWSPDSPHLYALETQIVVGNRVIDATRERFGFREFSIRGKDFLLNGEIHRTRMLPGARFVAPDPYRFISKPAQIPLHTHFADHNIATLQAARSHGFNGFRPGFRWGGMWGSATARQYFDAADELGMTTGLMGSLVDNHNNRIAFTDPLTYDYAERYLKAATLEHLNRPAIMWLNLGNEITGSRGPSTDPKVAELLAAMEKRVRAFDPTRFVVATGANGGFDGRASIYSPHYPGVSGQGGNMAPAQWWWFTARYEDIPADLRQRALWPDPDPTGRYKGMKNMPGGGWANVPVFNDEYAWLASRGTNGLNGDGQAWAGERALKPFQPRIPNLEIPIGSHLAYLERIDMETQAYRANGMAGLQRWDWNFRLPESPFAPLVAFVREQTRAHFSDQPVTRTLHVVNDAETPASPTLEVRVSRLAADGARTRVLTETFSPALGIGGLASHPFTIPPQSVDSPTRFALDVVRTDQGRDQILHRQQYTAFPRAWVGELPKNARVLVFDPKGSVTGLFESLGVTPTPVTELAKLPVGGPALLVIGEDAPAAELQEARPQLAEFMGAGGTVVALRQAAEKGIENWLPVNFEDASDYRGNPTAGVQTSLLARQHPLFDGLLPDDLGQWGPHGLVFGTGFQLTQPFPNARVLLGLAPYAAQLVEGRYGQGRWIATTLELTPENMKTVPPAARLVANLVRLSAAAAPVPASAKTIVYAPETTTKVAQNLVSRLKLDADLTATPPALAGVQTLILAGWSATTPDPAFARTVGGWVRSGGTLLVERGGESLAPWLAQVIGRGVTAERAFDNDLASKLVVHPLLEGIAEGDLHWTPLVRRPDTPPAPGNFADTLLRVEGATELLWPAALTVTELGKGRIVVNQAKWDESTLAPRAQRYERTLLTNLGLNFRGSAYGEPSERFTVPAGLAFTPIDIGRAANLPRLREFGFDKLPSSLEIAGVPFRLGMGSKVILGVHTGARLPAELAPLLGKLPAESSPIAVGRRANHLLFAHTAAYHAMEDGAVVFTYVVRYEGHEKIIGGMDTTDLIVEVPVRAGANVRDWFTPAGNRVPSNGATFKTQPTVDTAVFAQRWDNPFPDRVIDSVVVRANPAATSQPFVLGITAASTSPASSGLE